MPEPNFLRSLAELAQHYQLRYDRAGQVTIREDPDKRGAILEAMVSGRVISRFLELRDADRRGPVPMPVERMVAAFIRRLPRRHPLRRPGTRNVVRRRR